MARVEVTIKPLNSDVEYTASIETGIPEAQLVGHLLEAEYSRAESYAIRAIEYAVVKREVIPD